jgi:hypothetical protein
MARVKQQVKSTRGKSVSCGRCGKAIAPGDKYYRWAFRYGGKQYRCSEHPPKQSELTQSKMSQVYDAVEDAHQSLASAETVEDVRTIVEEVAGAVSEVVDEYREAAEQFGGGGPNAERADELEGWQSDLESFDPNVDDAEWDEDRVGMELAQEMFGVDNPADLDGDDRTDWLGRLQEKRDEWEEGEGKELAAEALDAVRGEAEDVLNSCPL